MNRRNYDLHVNILGWLFIVGHVLFVVMGVFVFFLLNRIGALVDDAMAEQVLSVVGTSVLGLMVVLALPGLGAGYGLLKRASWGKVLALVVSFLHLINFPLGTALGVYAFIVLLQEPDGVGVEKYQPPRPVGV